jgi:hypothetical protein
MPIQPQPRRKIESAEILSSLFPSGATIVIEDDDEVVPYTGRIPVIPSVKIMRRAGAGLADAGSDDDDDNPQSRPDSPNSSLSILPASQSAPSRDVAPETVCQNMPEFL